LLALDACAIGLAFVVATWSQWSAPLVDVIDLVVALVAVLVTGLLVAHGQRLYRSRSCVVRSVERAKLLVVAVTTAVTSWLLGEALGFGVRGLAVAGCASIAFAALVAERSAFRHWLGVQRRRGRHRRRVVLVGGGDEAAYLARLFAEHPELGLDVCGHLAVGRPSPDLALRRLGRPDDLVRAAAQVQATGVVMAASGLRGDQLNRLVREAHGAGLHVTISGGLHGISHRRIRPAPLAYEPLQYVEAARISPLVLTAKRALDVVGAIVLLVCAAPFMALAAIAIKLDSRGPVLFRQVRVGRGGEPFTFFKLRTMVPGSDVAVDGDNERLGGPLYKHSADPRRTRVGKVLEATSVDELPQLWNVLRGDMSLVGPRPALEREVADFDEELLARHHVRPGITGLWQVECRDNPHFAAYRRLDLFYVENLSLWLDAAILSTTLEIVVIRAVQKLGDRRRRRAKPVEHEREPEAATVPAEPSLELVANGSSSASADSA
jgi:exopolysaccharide biosynthesis polyprenyl glycosylphosphotransferase